VTPAGGRTYGNALAEDANGTIYLGITRDRPRTWTRAGRAQSAIFKSQDGAHWELLTKKMAGGVMDICAAPDDESVLVSTSDHASPRWRWELNEVFAAAGISPKLAAADTCP
jgi:hypothetical protein